MLRRRRKPSTVEVAKKVAKSVANLFASWGPFKAASSRARALPLVFALMALLIVSASVAAVGPGNTVSPEAIQKLLLSQGVSVPQPFVLQKKSLTARLGPETTEDLVVVYGNGYWLDTLAILGNGKVKYKARLDQLGPGSSVDSLSADYLLGTPYPQLVVVYNGGSTGTRYWRSITYLYVFSYVPGVGIRQIFTHVLKDEWHRADKTIVKTFPYRFVKESDSQASSIVVEDKALGVRAIYQWTGTEYKKFK